MQATSRNILVIAAHPDDEVLGCGGTIARLALEGNHVFIAILGEGETSRYPQRDLASRESVRALRGCSRQVAELLGARDLFMHELPDNRFDTLPLLDIVKIIEELIQRLQPEIIYTHHGGDLNVDHAAVHRAVLTATRPVPGFTVKEIYAFEVPSSTEWAFGQLPLAFRSNVYMDISTTLDAKLKAMALYGDEMQPFPHPRSLEALQANAHRWGSVSGLKAAEAFELVRKNQ